VTQNGPCKGLSGCMAEDLRAYTHSLSIVVGSVAINSPAAAQKDASKVLTASDVAHAVAMIANQPTKLP